MKIPALATGLILVLSLALFKANAQVQSVGATIDANKTYAPISPYVYGLFIEHLGGVINNGMWAEIVVGQASGVEVEEQAIDSIPTMPTFAPFSVTIYNFPANRAGPPNQQTSWN